MNSGERTVAGCLAEFTLRYEPEEQVKARAMACLRDSIGCMMAGVHEPAAAVVRAYAAGRDSRPEASAIGMRKKMDAALCALVNGVTINALDFDDVSVPMNGHPSAVILPAAMAMAEQYNASGEEFLNAYVTGVEVASALGRGVCPESFRRGWHCTAVIGVFGAVAAAGRLSDLTRQQLESAFGLAASEASGVKGNLGSPAKPIHCGRAAQKAIETVRLVQCGCEANPFAVESSDGICQLISGEMDKQAVLDAVSSGKSVFISPGVGLKAYPSCKCTFNGIDAVLELTRENALIADRIASVECGLQKIGYENLKFHMPVTALQKKLSMEYCLATAILENNVSLADFTDEAPSKECQSLMSRIVVSVDAQLEAYPEDTTAIRITCTDGRVYENRVEFAKGDPENPMLSDEVREKFLSCCSARYTRKEAEILWEELGKIPELHNCQEYFRQMLTHGAERTGEDQ